MIYICLPVHDEASTVGPLMWKLRRTLTDPDFRRDFRIMALDDASTDGTGDVLERYRSALPLTVIRSDERLGYGRAVDRLLRAAAEETPYPKRDAAVVLQADFTDDPSFVVDLIKAIEGGADIVSGVGGLPDEPAPRGLRWARRAAPWVLGRVHRDAPVDDPLCGYRAYRLIVPRKALRDDEPPLCTSREPWAASLELLARLIPHARRVEEVPLATQYRLLARPSRFKAVRALRELLRLRGGSPWATPAEAAEA
ncbi:MAG: glycosyltransferase family 2 protein [Gemmatimonadetes bacterium]|nr:glycosyltransferase family 2 protein [Gemmatimonadota bacterium]